jgi:hypothetical protein
VKLVEQTHADRSRLLRRSLVVVASGAAFLAGLSVVLMLALNRAPLQQVLGGEAPPWAWAVLCTAAVLSNAVASTWLWWRLLVAPDRLSVGRGALVGLLGGLVTHPLAWWCTLLTSVLVFGVFGGAPVSATVIALLDSVPLSVIQSSYSLMAFGWLTLVLGALGGGLLAYALRHGERP